VVNAAFSPSEEEERWARRVLAATEAEGTGAFRLGDEMIDRPVVERAKRILARVIGGNGGE
jgi:citrate lyase subunit beta/citryl-CoA lyase